MTDPLPGHASLTRTRIFLLFFFGLAALLIVTTIVGTLRNMDEQKILESQPAASAPAQ